MSKAQVAIVAIDPGKTFVLKDLFDGYEWKSLSVGERTSFGRVFKNAVLNHQINNVKYAGKLSNNSAYYVKE